MTGQSTRAGAHDEWIEIAERGGVRFKVRRRGDEVEVCRTTDWDSGPAQVVGFPIEIAPTVASSILGVFADWYVERPGSGSGSVENGG